MLAANWLLERSPMPESEVPAKQKHLGPPVWGFVVGLAPSFRTNTAACLETPTTLRPCREQVPKDYSGEGRWMLENWLCLGQTSLCQRQYAGRRFVLKKNPLVQ